MQPANSPRHTGGLRARLFIRSSVASLSILISLILYTGNAFAQQTFTVSSTADSGSGSLREAINSANSNGNSGQTDIIQFAFPGTPEINLLSVLPPLTEPVIIDGSTQGAPVVLDGNSFTAASTIVDYGLRIRADNSAIYGMEIRGFAYGIQVGGNANWTIGASGKGNILYDYSESGIGTVSAATDPLGAGTIQHNTIGLLADGLTAATTMGNNGVDVRFAANVIIRDNLIANNAEHGVRLFESCSDITVQDNRIGITATGDDNRGNTLYGVSITTNSSNNLVKGNRIGFLGGGVLVGTGCAGNTLTENTIFCHSGATGQPIVLQSGANDDLAAPFISSASCREVQGTAPSGATVHLYYRDETCPATYSGKEYIGSVAASGTGWVYTSSTDLSGVLVATATLSGSTSAFSSAHSISTAPPHPGIITGERYPTESTAEPYATSAGAQSSTYAWSFSNPVVDPSGNTSESVSITWPAYPFSGILQVAESDICGQTSQLVALNIEIVPVTSAITPTLADPVTGGDVRTYQVDAHNGSVYNWSVTSPAFITANNGNEVTIQFGNSDATVSVTETYYTASGVAISRPAFHQKSLAVSVTPTDAPVTSGISGPGFDESNPVPGQSEVVFSVADNPGNTYTWTAPPGATIVSGQGTSSVTVSLDNQNGDLCVTETNSASVSGTPVCQKVLVKPVTGPVTGELSPTENETYVYSIGTAGQTGPSQRAKETGINLNMEANNFEWQVSGGTIISGQGTPQIEVQWDFGLGGEELTLYVTETNTDPPISGEEVITPVILRPNLFAVEGPVRVDAGSQGVIYSVRNRELMTFSWSVPPGATIASGSGSNVIQVNFGNQGGEISVIGTSLGVPSLPSKMQVGMKPYTSDISGPDELEAGLSGSYSVTGSAGSTYNWTFSNNGSTVSTPNASLPNQISLQAGSYGGKLCVTESSSTGVEGATVCKDIVVIPGAGQIQGPAEVDAYTSANYNLPLSSGATASGEVGAVYRWSIPNGAVITAGRGTESITVDFGRNTGNIKVEKGNASSDSLIVRELSVTVIPPPVDPLPPANDPGSPGNLGGGGTSLGGGNGTCTNCDYDEPEGDPTEPRDWNGDTPPPPARPPRPPSGPDLPQIAITPVPVDFNDEAYNTRPARKAFIISNTGDAYLYIEGIYFLTEEFAYRFKGETDTEFTLVSQPANYNRGFSIAPGRRIVFELISLAPEHRSFSRPDASITVVSNDPDDNDSATGNYATISLTKK
ncbi:MAG: right-handed parallel beta-helix repeat-containing protein [Cyclobacteriaceae bacterium]